MFRVLIADDEPLILSGIKFLIDWGKWDCAVTDTARNGGEALERIRAQKPDIVICDINMPVLSGIEVLRQASEEGLSPVFIMLTNHQEFDMARESLRFKAIDYLLKSQLEPATLEKALAAAIEESGRRRSLARVELVENYIQVNKETLVADNVKNLLSGRQVIPPEESARILAENHALERFLLASFQFDFSALPNIEDFSAEEKERLYDWEREVVEKLACNLFSDFVLFTPDESPQSLLFYAWNQPSECAAAMGQLMQKLRSASGRVTQARLGLLWMGPFSGADELIACRDRLLSLEDAYYIGGKSESELQWPPAPEKYAALDNRSACAALSAAVREKDMRQCSCILEGICADLSGAPHRRADGIRFCTDLYLASATAMLPFLPDTGYHYFRDESAVRQHIRRFLTREQTLAWLEKLSNRIVMQLEELSAPKSDAIERAKSYVLAHIGERIMLQDVADEIGISPNYLSAQFKKQYDRSFVDYVNLTKTHRACELIREGRYRIGEISYMLGYENAYYFTRVFKRHVGLTPTEYQYKEKPKG